MAWPGCDASPQEQHGKQEGWGPKETWSKTATSSVARPCLDPEEASAQQQDKNWRRETTARHLQQPAPYEEDSDDTWCDWKASEGNEEMNTATDNVLQEGEDISDDDAVAESAFDDDFSRDYKWT